MEQHGIDISELRLDDLDKQILHFALDYKAGDKVAIDIGCGFGRVSIMLALAGFEVWLFDKRDLSEHFAQVAKMLEIEGKLKFFRKDIAKITENDLPACADRPKKFSIVIAQRVLHHLPFVQVKQIVQILSSKLVQEGRVFASFSGLDSEIAKDYECIAEPVEQRYCKVSKENREKFKMTEPVCLYSKNDVKKLFAGTGLMKEKLYVSSFGNIKAVYYNESNGFYKLKRLLWKLFQS